MSVLCNKGYRILSVQHPPYYTFEDFLKGFDQFLDMVGLNNIHIFGVSLGGFLSLLYCQYKPSRVESIILCNAFCDTTYFVDNAPCMAMFPYMPAFMLRKLILANFPTGTLEPDIANSVDFMVLLLDKLNQEDLSSRLTLNCLPCNLKKISIPEKRILIVDCLDEVAVPTKLREQLYATYNNTKKAFMKLGGNFPYLAYGDEINLYIEVHLRKFAFGESKDEDSDDETHTTTRNTTTATTTSTTTTTKAVVTPSNPPETVESETVESKKKEPEELKDAVFTKPVIQTQDDAY